MPIFLKENFTDLEHFNELLNRHLLGTIIGMQSHDTCRTTRQHQSLVGTSCYVPKTKIKARDCPYNLYILCHIVGVIDFMENPINVCVFYVICVWQEWEW